MTEWMSEQKLLLYAVARRQHLVEKNLADFGSGSFSPYVIVLLTAH